MEHNPLFAVWINRLLKSAAAIAGIHFKGDPLPAHVIMAMIVTLILVIFFKLTVKNLTLFPSKMQTLLESLYLIFRNIVDDMIGTEGRKFIPALGTLGLFIALSNLLGLLPEMASPTANLNAPAGCAIFIFLYYHSQGVKKHGFFGYLKTFTGPAWWLGWLFAPIEIISHFSRPMSLTVRLFCNIFGEDLVIIILVSLVPFFAPLPMMAMAIFTSLLQAYIFIMLSSVYLAGAIASEHYYRRKMFMRKKSILVVAGLLALTAALPAQSPDKTMSVTTLFFWTILIGSVCLTVAAMMGIFGQSKAFCNASDNIARNPAAANSIRGLLIIALALMESLVIYVLLIDLILFFVRWGNYTVR